MADRLEGLSAWLPDVPSAGTLRAIKMLLDRGLVSGRKSVKLNHHDYADVIDAAGVERRFEGDNLSVVSGKRRVLVVLDVSVPRGVVVYG